MVKCEVRSPLPALKWICVDDAASDPLSSACKAGRAPLREALSLLAATAPGVDLLDVGGHLGLVSLPFAAAGRKVTALEANPANAELLRASACANGFEIDVHNLAVADKSGSLVFHPSGPFGSVAGAHIPPDRMTINVPAVSLDEWPAASGVGERIVVKMDIEGSEPKALAGMRRFLSARRFPPLFVESNALCLSWFGETPGKLAQIIESLGYEIYVAHLSRWMRWRNRFELHSWTSSQPQKNAVVNLLCVQHGDDRVIH